MGTKVLLSFDYHQPFLYSLLCQKLGDSGGIGLFNRRARGDAAGRITGEWRHVVGKMRLLPRLFHAKRVQARQATP
jgi:hypothetical protein